MSTVLWANVIANERVISDQLDKPALYKSIKKVDKLCQQQSLGSFAGLLDYTDMRVNMGELDLPDNMQSTDELMLAQGVWLDLVDAEQQLQMLADYIDVHQIKFGVLFDARQSIIAELTQTLDFIGAYRQKADKFNFSVVM